MFSTVLSHHQAFWKTDPVYQHLYCILGSQKLTIGSTVNIKVHVSETRVLLYLLYYLL